MRKNSEINYRCDSVNEIVPTKEKVCHGGVINRKSDHVKKEKMENSTSKREKSGNSTSSFTFTSCRNIRILIANISIA